MNWEDDSSSGPGPHPSPHMCHCYPAVLRIITRNSSLFLSTDCWYVAAVTAGQPVTTRCRSKLVLASLLLWLTWAPFIVAQLKPCSPDERVPKCQQNACVVRRVTGLAEEVSVCNACQPGYSRINRARACGEIQLFSRAGAGWLRSTVRSL